MRKAYRATISTIVRKGEQFIEGAVALQQARALLTDQIVASSSIHRFPFYPKCVATSSLPNDMAAVAILGVRSVERMEVIARDTAPEKSEFCWTT